MSNMSKNELICITGKMGSGKTTMANFLKSKGYLTFIFDDWINEIYKNGNIGYLRIKKFFGEEFINEIEVNKSKLLNFILLSNDNKNKLDLIMLPIIETKIKQLKQTNQMVFIELGIYIYFPFIFEKYFKYVIAIDSLNKSYKKDAFFELNKNIVFSTKHVENSNKVLFSNNIYVDFIVENCCNLDFFYKNIEKLLNSF